MRRNTILFACFLSGYMITMAACHSASRQGGNRSDTAVTKLNSPVAENDMPSLAGSWYLQPELASDTGTGKIPEITFTTTENRFSGNTGCNRMTGIYIRKGDSLRFDERIVTTRMACMGYNEKTFLDNLLRTNHYVIKEGVLMLMENETILSKWMRHLPDQPVKKA